MNKFVATVLLAVVVAASAETPSDDGLQTTMKRINPNPNDWQSSYNVNFFNPTIKLVSNSYTLFNFLPHTRTLGQTYNVINTTTGDLIGAFDIYDEIAVAVKPNVNWNADFVAVPQNFGKVKSVVDCRFRNC